MRGAWVEDARLHIMRSCELETVFAESAGNVASLLEQKAETPRLKRIVQMRGPIEPALKKIHPDIQLLELEKVMQMGDKSLRPFQPPAPADTYLICHTSGTTGPPKGVLISNQVLARTLHFPVQRPLHAELRHADVLPQLLLREDRHPDEARRRLLLLPPVRPHVRAHRHRRPTHECKGHPLILGLGGVGFSKLMRILSGFLAGVLQRRSDKALGRHAGAAPDARRHGTPHPQPHPRQRHHRSLPAHLRQRAGQGRAAGVEEGGWLKKTLFHKALSAKMELLKKGTICRDSIWDRVVLRRLQALTGGRLGVVYSGGAPVDPEVTRLFLFSSVLAAIRFKVLQFFRAAFGAVVMEGYGQTENTAAATLATPRSARLPYPASREDSRRRTGFERT